VGQLAAAVQEVTGETLELAYVDQGYTGDAPAEAAKAHDISLEVAKLPEGEARFCPAAAQVGGRALFAWAARFRRLARDYERLPQTVAGLHFVAFVTLMLAKTTALFDLLRNTLWGWGPCPQEEDWGRLPPFCFAATGGNNA
jgi:transposase